MFSKKEIKEKIEAEISKTKLLISDYTELTQPIEPENAIGRISRMDAIHNKSVVEAALRQSKSKLEKLETALTKTDSDDFGVCIGCHKPIPLGRILIMPHSVTCVSCSS